MLSGENIAAEQLKHSEHDHQDAADSNEQNPVSAENFPTAVKPNPKRKKAKLTPRTKNKVFTITLERR